MTWSNITYRCCLPLVALAFASPAAADRPDSPGNSAVAHDMKHCQPHQAWGGDGCRRGGPGLPIR